MSTVSGVITFGLPDDPDFNQLKIYSASTEDGSYSVVETQSYEYPTETAKLDILNETLYYKIQYHNSVSSASSAISDAVAGSKFSEGAPFFAITSKTDGISLSSTEEFYDYTNLTTEDVTNNDVLKALKKARAYMDLKLGDTGLGRFTDTWDTSISRRKYNAVLEMSKEAEVNFAASIVFKNMSDVFMLQALRGEKASFRTVNIGSTSIGGNTSDNPINVANFLTSQAVLYAQEGSDALLLINSTRIPTIYNGIGGGSPRFLPPWCK